MHLWQLALKEALHRRMNFSAGLLSVAIAVGCVVGALALLQAHDARTETLIVEKEAETRAAMLRLEDDYRRIMRDMGYNVLILHEDQDLGTLHDDGTPNVFMPDNYAEKLAEGGIKTLNHLLPILQQKAYWEERQIEVLVAGIRGQVPIAHRQRAPREGGVGPDGSPIMEPVPRDHVDVGHAIAQRFNLEPGAAVQFNGANLTVNRCFPHRGGQDDMTMWVHLEQAQDWFEKPGKINGILALECICQADSLGKIIADVNKILPDTQVFEFSSLVRTRALARQRAADAHREAVEAERHNRAVMRDERERMASFLAPLAVAGAAVWIFLLTFANVRDRRAEIGILRALGYDASRIVGLFQLRTLMMSIPGAIAGYVGGVIAGVALGGGADSWRIAFTELASPTRMLAALAAASALAFCAALIPALKAAGQDPADILREIV